MKLWLDDVRPMPTGFDAHVKTAFDAIVALGSGKFTEISFDHDLGDDRPDNTGAGVAKWIEGAAYNGKLQRLKWAVHSDNPPGRKNIEMAMMRAERYWDDNAIASFTGPNRYLSNFDVSEVEFEGMKYPTVEHAFQAAKTLDSFERERVLKAPTPGQAKRIGRLVTLRSDWEDVKIEVMEDLVYKKFSTHKDIQKKLLLTKDRELIEGNDWGDTFWGKVQVASGALEGENHLGKILMRVRERLRKEVL